MIRGKAEADSYVNAKAEHLTPLHHLATDCLRLSIHFFHPIQQSAQQVYHSALPLSPTSSQLQKSCLQTVIDNYPSHVTTFSGAPGTWGSLLRTIDTRPKQLTCIATSVRRIIAACEDIINTYDAATFMLQQSLHAPETVTKIQGSPDGSILFFAHSFSVTMWDVQTGGLNHTFNMQSEVSDIAVSTTHIACGSSGGSVTFWDIRSKAQGEDFGNGQPVVTIHWLSPQELAVATQNTLYIHNIVDGETPSSLPIPGRVWGMVYLENKGEFLVGASLPDLGVGKELSFLRVIKFKPGHPSRLQELEPLLTQPQMYPGVLSNPTLVGEELVCITPPSGVQSFDRSLRQTNNKLLLLGAATSVTVSLNRNLVAQTKHSIQIFSLDVLAGGGPHNNVRASHVYSLGGNHIIRILQPTRCLNLLELETLQELSPRSNISLQSLLADRSTSARAFSCGLVAEFGISVVSQAWQSGTPLPEWAGAADEDVPLSGWSPEGTRIATAYGSPRRELRVEDMEDGTTLASLPLEDADCGIGEVYDVAFDSETRFYLKIDGPGKHIQIPYDITASPSGQHSHTITKGEPAPLQESRKIPPYTLDANCEWVLDAKSRKICWISPENIRRGDGGHFWAGLSLVMVGGDGVVRKLTFKESDIEV